jgi:phospholipase/carboxylesterase
MTQSLEFLPAGGTVEQLFVLLHGVGATPASLLPLAEALSGEFPRSAVVIPEGIAPFGGGGDGRQWFSIDGITEATRPGRVEAALPAVVALVREAQTRFGVTGHVTALGGFSQGAIMALEAAVRTPDLAGRVLAFSGRFSTLPASVPERTSFHLLHGEDDAVISASHARVAFAHLSGLGGDATVDLARGVGHELHPALVAQALRRLRTCAPLHIWREALGHPVARTGLPEQPGHPATRADS